MADRSQNIGESTENHAKQGVSHRGQIAISDSPSDVAFFKLFNASSDLITISSLGDGTLLDVNDSFLRGTGRERDAITGQSLSGLELWPPNDWATLATALQRGPSHNIEVAFLTMAGERRTGLMSLESVHLRDKRCFGLVPILETNS